VPLRGPLTTVVHAYFSIIESMGRCVMIGSAWRKDDLPAIVFAAIDHRPAQRDPTLVVTVTNSGQDSLDVEYVAKVWRGLSRHLLELSRPVTKEGCRSIRALLRLAPPAQLRS
jgi:hypothetical protein